MITTILEKMLDFFSFNKKSVRLRQILETAALIEKNGQAFYEKFAQKVQDPDVKNLCLSLAADEKRHSDFIEQILSGWRSLDEKALPFKDVFEAQLRSGASVQEVIDVAMDLEKRTIKFYEKYQEDLEKTLERNRRSSKFGDSAEAQAMWKLEKIDGLIDEEWEHYKRLSRFR